MELFWQQAWFFTFQLFKFMTLFYTVWAPGFLVAALLILRFRQSTWKKLLHAPPSARLGIWRAIQAGIVGSVDRDTSRRIAWKLLDQGHRPATALAYLIASRNMTIHFLAVFALSLGAEFAAGQVLGALVMIGTVALCCSMFRPALTATASNTEHDEAPVLDLVAFTSWRASLLSFGGWRAMLKLIGQEIVRFAPTLGAGIVLGGIIFAAGLEPWWVPFADIMGAKTLASDLINALVSPTISAAMFLSPVGNLPVIHALFKADGLAYPGIISFCLASAIHPGDVRVYIKTFGAKQGLLVVGLLYGATVLGGLGSTWIYAIFGFRPDLPPLELMHKLFAALGF